MALLRIIMFSLNWLSWSYYIVKNTSRYLFVGALFNTVKLTESEFHLFRSVTSRWTFNIFGFFPSCFCANDVGVNFLNVQSMFLGSVSSYIIIHLWEVQNLISWLTLAECLARQITNGEVGIFLVETMDAWKNYHSPTLCAELDLGYTFLSTKLVHIYGISYVHKWKTWQRHCFKKLVSCIQRL